jgi:hypothetical protein
MLDEYPQGIADDVNVQVAGLETRHPRTDHDFVGSSWLCHNRTPSSSQHT